MLQSILAYPIAAAGGVLIARGGHKRLRGRRRGRVAIAHLADAENT